MLVLTEYKINKNLLSSNTLSSYEMIKKIVILNVQFYTNNWQVITFKIINIRLRKYYCMEYVWDMSAFELTNNKSLS